METSKQYLLVIGENVRKQRDLHKMSQQELADLSNVAKSTIQRIEKGQINPTILMLKKIADTMGVDILDLIKPR